MSLLDDLSELAKTGGAAYKDFTAPTAEDILKAQTKANKSATAAKTASYTGWIIGGAVALVLLVGLALLFRRP